MINRYKHIILTIGCWLLCVSPTVVMAQKRGAVLGGGSTNFSSRQKDDRGLLTGYQSAVRHMFGVYTSGAFFSSLFNEVSSSVPIGYGVGGGICYDLQRYYFRMQVGLGVRVQTAQTLVKDITMYDYTVSDALGYPYILRYDFKDRVDHCQNVSLQMPLLFGAGFRNMYALGGIKLNMICSSIATTSVIGSTSAKYDQFLGDLTEMDNHGLRKDVQIDYSEKIRYSKSWPFDVLTSIDVGAEWGTEYTPLRQRYQSETTDDSSEFQWRVRLAAFCDFGLLPVGQCADKLVDIPQDTKWDFCTFKMNNVLVPDCVSKAGCHNFFVGIKLTLSIGTLPCERCRLLNDYQSEVDY